MNWSFLREAAPLSTPAKANGTTQEMEFTTYVRDKTIITDLRSWGFRTAGASEASPEVLQTVTGWLYRNQLNVDDEVSRRERDRVSALKREIDEKQTELERVAAERDHLAKEAEQVAATEAEKKHDIERIRGGDSTFGNTSGRADRVAFYIGIAILLLLSVYLFLFYISAIYNAFLFDPVSAQRNAITSGRDLVATIFNGSALREAWGQGYMTFMFLFAAPSLVLGLGFLIHHFSQQKKLYLVILLLAATLAFDALLAYAIVAEMYEIRYLTGLESVPWEAHFITNRPAFYIIMFGGFVAYLIWGAILSYALGALEKSRPGLVALGSLKAEISQLRVKAAALRAQSKECEHLRIGIEGDIRALETQMEAAEKGQESFLRHVEELMHGWLSYIAQAFSADSKERSQQAMRIRDDTVARLLGQTQTA